MAVHSWLDSRSTSFSRPVSVGVCCEQCRETVHTHFYITVNIKKTNNYIPFLSLSPLLYFSLSTHIHSEEENSQMLCYVVFVLMMLFLRE